MVKARIEEAINQALASLGAGEAKFVVERPGRMEHGDYSTNAALVARVDPQELAKKLQIEGIEKVEVMGKFINFFLSRDALLDIVKKTAAEKINATQLYQGKTVLVEYTSPNLFKPLHIGNLVGNILGESLARLFEATGAKVKRINYPSDIGLTVAKGVWGLWKHKLNPENIAELGKAYAMGNEAYEGGSAKAEIDEVNRALYEDSNVEWSALRKQGIQTSLEHLDELCERLGTKFDREFFESETGSRGKEIVQKNTGVFEESEGAIVFRGSHTRVFLNSAGLPTYEAKELGLFELKSEAFPDFVISITVTGSEQKDFFKVVFEAIEKLFAERIADKVLSHIPNGFLRLTTGKMSSRKGNVITGESLLEELQEKARGREDVAVGAVKYAVLKQSSNKDIVFDPEKSLSLEGDSGPYLQYARVRALSLLQKAEAEGLLGDGKTWPSGLERRPSAALPLERILIHFPNVVERAAEEYEPHYVTTYLTELASAFNSFYASERIIGGNNPTYGVLLTQAVERTLAQGLWLLGIPLPERM